MRALLEGIRIIDAAIAAQPLLSRILSDFGAEVIRVETPSRPHRTRNANYPDGRPEDYLYWEQGGGHHDIQRNKLGVAVEIAKPLGREVFKKLVAISDVVMENSPSGTMKKFGLDYPRLREVNPGIIMLSTTGYGHGGPYTKHRAYGINIEPMSGMTSMMGYDEPHSGTIPYPDQIAVYHGAVAVLAALRQRRRTGKGQWIDLSMCAAALSTMGEAAIDYSMNRRLRRPMGNRDDVMAPHGCYRCQGPDNWVAIAVNGDEQWKSFCIEMGNPTWCSQERFATVEGRRAHLEGLDEFIGEWTA
ncbi:MAG: CoA transferase, partial [Dehalococcoidia bacterium]|nr:CoA transferase [Dehalococcoidia bacterium]